MKRRFVNIIKKFEEGFTYLVTVLVALVQLVLGTFGFIGTWMWVAGCMESGHPMGGLSYLVERLGRLDPNGGKVESFLAKACQEFVRLANGETWIYLTVLAVGLLSLRSLAKNSPKKNVAVMKAAFAELNCKLSEAWRKLNALPAVGKAKAAFGKAKAARAARAAKQSTTSAKLDREIGKLCRTIQRDGL